MKDQETPISFSEVTDHVQHDLEVATKLARSIATEYFDVAKDYHELQKQARFKMLRMNSLIQASHNLASHLEIEIPFTIVGKDDILKFLDDYIQIEYDSFKYIKNNKKNEKTDN